MTRSEIKQRERVTSEEQEAVDVFIAAARVLPKSICVEVSDGYLVVRKRVSRGCAVPVARLRKKSLVF
jgi:hypothetical protein